VPPYRAMSPLGMVLCEHVAAALSVKSDQRFSSLLMLTLARYSTESAFDNRLRNRRPHSIC
jgi:hypothetical protein